MKPQQRRTLKKIKRAWRGKARWEISFHAVMQQHNGYCANRRKTASVLTQKQRYCILFEGFQTLAKIGFPLKTVFAFKQLHLIRLVKHWQQQGCSAFTTQSRISTFRIFACWIGKPNMVLPLKHYIQNRAILKRIYVPKTPKISWIQLGINPDEKIHALRIYSERLADALALQYEFGLRIKESLLLRPHLADKGRVLAVTQGTRDGQSRTVSIKTKTQRQLLNKLKNYLKKNACLVPNNKSYKQFRNQYYYILRKHGICRKNGIVTEALHYEHNYHHHHGVTV